MHCGRWYFLLFLLFHHSVMMCVQEQILPSSVFLCRSSPRLFLALSPSSLRSVSLSRKYTNVINSEWRQWAAMTQSNVRSLLMIESMNEHVKKNEKKKREELIDRVRLKAVLYAPMYATALNICSNWSLSLLIGYYFHSQNSVFFSLSLFSFYFRHAHLD